MCGDPPAVTNERVRLEVEGKANAISKLVGALGFGVAYEKSREDILSKYGDSNAARADQYLYFLVCNTLERSTTLTDEQKIQAIFKMRSLMPDAHPTPGPDPTVLPQPSQTSIPIHPEMARQQQLRRPIIVLQTALPEGQTCNGPSVERMYPKEIIWDNRRTVKPFVQRGMEIEFDAPITPSQFELLSKWVNNKTLIIEYFECSYDGLLISRLAESPKF